VTAMMQDMVLSMGLTFFDRPLTSAMRRQACLRH
jgi:hypothetical protein